MNAARWIGRSAFLFALSFAVGWFIPDGLGRLGSMFGGSDLSITSTDRLLSFFVVFMFLTAVDLMIWLRGEIRALRESIPLAVRRVLLADTSTALDGSLLQVMFDGFRANPANHSHMVTLLRSFFVVMARVPSNLLAGYSVILERSIQTLDKSLHQLAGEGLVGDIRDTVEITKRLAERSQSYLQIQRRAFRVPEEWTKEWMQLVEALGKQSIACEYIVLLPRDRLDVDLAKLESMDAYLTGHNWRFRYCEVEAVLNSLGGALPTDRVVEVFDNRIAKLQELPDGRYRGGIKLKMTVIDLEQRGDVRHFVTCILNSATRLPPRAPVAQISS